MAKVVNPTIGDCVAVLLYQSTQHAGASSDGLLAFAIQILRKWLSVLVRHACELTQASTSFSDVFASARGSKNFLRAGVYDALLTKLREDKDLLWTIRPSEKNVGNETSFCVLFV